MILTDEVVDRVHRLNVEVVRLTAQGFFKEREDAAEANLGTGYGLYAGPDSPLTQVAGFAHRSPGDVQQIERFFAPRTENWEVTVTPFTDAGSFRELLDLGYRPGGFEGELAQWIEDVSDEPTADIREVEGDLSVFNETSGRGWRENEGVEYVPGEIERAVAWLPARRYIAFVDGLPAAAAMLEFGDSVILAGATTRVPYRGRGLQSALLMRRLRDAGVGRFALMGAIPGSASYRNAQRAGFTSLYSKVTLMRH